MALLYSTATVMVFVGTCGIASLPDFDSIDESFEFRKELVPKPSHQDYQDHQACFTHCSCMGKLLTNRINIWTHCKDAASGNAKETKSITGDYSAPIRDFDMAWAIASWLVPRLGINNVNHNPSTLIKTLVAKNGGSCEKFCTQAKTIQHTSSWLKEDLDRTS